jgi:class 3 adenylate cyclase
MAARGNSNVICSIAFIDIVEYSKKSVEEQMRVKELFNGLLVQALADVPAADRIILDTGDGVAISFLGDPEQCLFFGLALRFALAACNDAALRLRTGINLGPVRLVKDINGQPNIIGDGINVAQRIMSFANVGQVLASRSFYEVISALSADYAQMFVFEGARTDKHVREHEVYSLGKAAAPERPPRKRSGPAVAGTGAALRQVESAATAVRVQVMRRPPLATALAVALILAVAVGLRPLLRGANPSTGAEPTPEVLPSPQRPRPLSAPAQTVPPDPAAELSSSPAAKVAREPTAAVPPRKKSAATGKVRLNILPWGAVYVDGEKYGVAPPLRDIALEPGTHRIEVRNPGFASYLQDVEVSANEEIRIQHRFR